MIAELQLGQQLHLESAAMVIHGQSSSNSRSMVRSHGPDIQPDLLVTSDYVKVERLGDYVKVEDYKRWKKDNDAALKELMRRSFIAGVLLGIFVLVAIIMAGVSLEKSGKKA